MPPLEDMSELVEQVKTMHCGYELKDEDALLKEKNKVTGYYIKFKHPLLHLVKNVRKSVEQSPAKNWSTPFRNAVTN